MNKGKNGFQDAPAHHRPGQAKRIHQQERFASQVQMELDYALLSAVTPMLNALTVLEVIPQGGSLLVVVGPRDPTEALDLKAATEALELASSMLHREVAAAVTRKEAPRLSFMVLPAGAEKVEE